MRSVSPFDHRQDRELGKALWELLTPEDYRAFVAQVVSRARSEFGNAVMPSPWDILSAWMRPGLVAAAALVLAAIVGLNGGRSNDSVTIDDELNRAAGYSEVQTLLHAPEPPDVDIVLVSTFER